MSGIRFTSNMEILMSVLRKLLEEEGEKGIDVLASGNSVTNGAPAV